MKRLFSYLFLALSLTIFSQTGPAGVGTSSNNVFWLKANAGTSSTVNTTPISAWNDQSGNSLNVTQTVAARQPSFMTNVMNGQPAIQFDNVQSTNDKMLGPDSPILDNTSGYSFFTVSRPTNLDGDARVIVSKRTTVSVDQSFMLFYYSGNRIHVDIQTTNDRFQTSTVFSNNNNYLFDVIYNGALPSASRVAVYVEETFDKFAAETSSLVPDNASPIILGTTDAGDPRPFGGYISEVIIYRDALVPAARIIVNNYLSAKYDIALSANDKYVGDNSGNGNYDFEVAGVGQESTGSSTSFSPSISGGLGISVTAGLDNGDYLLAGHASMANSSMTTDVGGMSGINNARWQRIWYVDVTNTSTNISANVEFDLSDGGSPGTPSTSANYVLLYRSAQSGNWTELTTASTVTGDRIIFSAFTFTNDGYYTIGTKNWVVSPLPIELTNFEAKLNANKVDITWTTATEKNNSLFTVEKTKNGTDFEMVGTLKGAGNSSSPKSYALTDPNPYTGISYYRLKQTDFNNNSSYSPLSLIDFTQETLLLSVYPNPTDGIIYITQKEFQSGDINLVVSDASGKSVFNKTLSIKGKDPLSIDLKDQLAAGTYLLKLSIGTKSYSQKIILK